MSEAHALSRRWRSNVLPRRTRKRASSGFNGFGIRDDDPNTDTADRLNADQVKEITTLAATVPAIHNAIHNLCASVFTHRGLEMLDADGTVIELDRTQELYVDEGWLLPLREVAVQLATFGIVAVDLQPIGNKSNSAFVAVAKSHGDVVASTAIKQKQLVVIDNSLIRLDFVQEHTVAKHPTACVFQLGRGVYRNGNV